MPLKTWGRVSVPWCPLPKYHSLNHPMPASAGTPRPPSVLAGEGNRVGAASEAVQRLRTDTTPYFRVEAE